jgi:hypothetical protein
MRYRTAVKTGRTAAMQLSVLRQGSFPLYVAMVERMADGYLRPLRARQPASKPMP